MANFKQKALFSATEFFFQAGLILVVPVFVAIDTVVIGHGIPEVSFTELTQAALLLLSTIVFAIGAWQRPGSRGCLVLVVGLFGCMLIRECDSFLDDISHGFWFYPAVALAAAAILYAARCRGTIVAPLATYAEAKFYTYISIGLLLVLLFSRIFGAGYLWREVMGSHYDPLYKTIIQEGLELLGYVLIAYGSGLFLLQKEVAPPCQGST